jgi:hypothetical protein
MRVKLNFDHARSEEMGSLTTHFATHVKNSVDFIEENILFSTLNP